MTILIIGNRFYCYYYSDTPNAMVLVTGELDKIRAFQLKNVLRVKLRRLRALVC